MAISLADLSQTGAMTAPPRAVIYGPHKIGKTTFGSEAPDPVFIPTEDGLNGIPGVTSFPLCKSYDEVMEAITALFVEDHSHKTVVVDSLDWLERLVHTRIMYS